MKPCLLTALVILLSCCNRQVIRPESIAQFSDGQSPLIQSDFYTIIISPRKQSDNKLLVCDTFWTSDYKINFKYGNRNINIRGFYFSDSLNYSVYVNNRDTIKRITGKDLIGIGIFFKKSKDCTFKFKIDDPIEELSEDLKERYIVGFDTNYFPGIIK